MFPVTLVSLPNRLAGLILCLVCVYANGQQADTVGKPIVPAVAGYGEIGADKPISFSTKLFSFIRSNGGSLGYVMNTNSGFNHSNYLPPFSQQLRLNYGLSISGLPILIGGQYGFGNQMYSADYFFITLDHSRLDELKRLKPTPLQKIRNTKDSLQTWNNQALDRLKSCERELEKYKKSPEFDQIQEYEGLSKTFADSFEYLDSSQLKTLFSKRKELESVRTKYNSYKQLKDQRQNLFDGYNLNVDSLQKLKALEENTADFDKTFPEKELKKLNFGIVQPSNGIQTSYGRPLRGLNLAYQYGRWYAEIVAGTSLKINRGIENENPENLLQIIGGLKTEKEEVLLHVTRINSRLAGKLFSSPLEQTNNIGLRAMKVLGNFRFEGDLSTSFYRNNTLNEGFDYSELEDSTFKAGAAEAAKPSYNYALSGTYTVAFFTFKLGHDYQGSAWRFGSLSFPNQNLSRYTAQMNVNLFKGKLGVDLGGSLIRVAKELGSDNRNYVFSSGLKWRINSFNTLSTKHQYVVSGNPQNSVEQNITSLSFSNVSQLFKKALISSFTLLRHELMSKYVYQQNFNMIAHSMYSVNKALNFTLMVQKFISVQTVLRNQTSVQVGCQGLNKNLAYQLNLGCNSSYTSNSFTGRAGIGWQSDKYRLSGNFNCTYNQMFTSVFLNNAPGESGHFSSPYNLITTLSLSYKL